MGSAAAACAIAVARPERAIELLEQGRTILWSQLLDTHADLHVLREAAPDLADDLERARSDLNATADPLGPDRTLLAAAAPIHTVDQRLDAARRWDATIAKIRRLPGFESFLQSPTARQLQAAAGDGTVVVLNVSPWRCDALAVTTAGTRLIPLPDLGSDNLADHSIRYITGLLEFEESVSKYVHGQGMGMGMAADLARARSAMEQSIITNLAWLWDTIAGPVLDALGHTAIPGGSKPWPRVWWCPTSVLILHPIHAAGRHDPDDQNPSQAVIDRVVSSYTPTLRILGNARAAETVINSDSRQLLLVAMPTTPGGVPLPNVAAERELLTTISAHECTVLQGPAATRAAVSAGLHHHQWAHFSCHGMFDVTNPAHSGIVLHDGILTVADIAAATHHGELAFLSACKTGAYEPGNPDEATNIAAALHYTGWQHVIGTLWSVWDDAAADVTTRTYTHLTDGTKLQPAGAAQALHHATRAARDRHPHQPSMWAPFIHLGP